MTTLGRGGPEVSRGQRHHPADRHQAARPAGRGAGRARPRTRGQRPGRHRGGRARGRRGGGPLRRAADGRAGQRAVL